MKEMPPTLLYLDVNDSRNESFQPITHNLFFWFVIDN